MSPASADPARAPRGPRAGLLARLRHRFADSEVIDAEAARREALRAGFDSVAEVGDRRKVQLIGYISSQVIQPGSAAPAVEVDLFDGTGTITLIWLGRDRISGIGPGTKLIVTGFAANRGHHRVMYNPRYEILAQAEEEPESVQDRHQEDA
ncbi:OB-fold nucleic acid binding domain-containing protein [Brachybacterium hainanense]|uniref:OB-fold nucleic acid binding domain-containing protein n=1 Tax=Brachybacterium hainanense TaxID=1541174 RepID=A0ABV6RDV8_9MICO